MTKVGENGHIGKPYLTPNFMIIETWENGGACIVYRE